ncbi:MAG: RnfABCDGE type electron transport complex subunit B [Kiritimatiellia bacterium]
MDIISILVTAGVIGGIAMICASALAIAAHVFAVQQNPRVAELEKLLPGINCGACGFAGCSDYAKAMAAEEIGIDRCAPGGTEVLEALAAATGAVAAAFEKMVAIVHCNGDAENAGHRHAYNGLIDCHAAHQLAGGDMSCSYGCLGYGSCARACPVDAIEIKNNLAIVHPDLCIGCKACVASCPRNIIAMVPASQSIHVLCSSKDKGPIAKKACKVACIGCRICTKLDASAFTMDGFLAQRNYASAVTDPAVIEKCPGKCIVDIGTPNVPAAPSEANQ